LARGHKRSERDIRAALDAAQRLERDVIVTAVTLAELFRGPHHNRLVDACLSRETGLDVRHTDKDLAKYVGGILAAAGASSEHLADAHVVAAAVEKGGGVVLTGDEDDLERLAATYPNVLVQGI
jgi:predicted nucleic acid-binding protein